MRSEQRRGALNRTVQGGDAETPRRGENCKTNDELRMTNEEGVKSEKRRRVELVKLVWSVELANRVEHRA